MLILHRRLKLLVCSSGWSVLLLMLFLLLIYCYGLLLLAQYISLATLTLLLLATTIMRAIEKV